LETFLSTLPVNETEQFALDVCRRSFLSLWCDNNPIAKPGKELCDILVICDPYVVIVSVKEIELKLSDQPEVEIARWERKAVDESVKQIYGAERWLRSAHHVIRGDGSRGLALPSQVTRKVHRIAVAFGSKGEVSIRSGDFGKGFVHVLSEHGFLDVLRELDTIEDLVEYLAAKERYCASTRAIIVQGGEANLLGWYLVHERSFPGESDMMIVDDTVWNGFRARPEVKRKREADRISYVWDRLIETLCGPNGPPIREESWKLDDIELALRAMARESRLSRRILGSGVREFLEVLKEKGLRSRILLGPSGVIYVLVCFGASESPEYRATELKMRCLVARHKIGKGQTMIGIGIGDFVPGVGSSSDLIYIHWPDWSAEDDELAERMQGELGLFKNASVNHSHEDEYPAEGKSEA
jgi:hypothetical protein